MHRDLLTLAEFSTEEIRDLLNLAADLKRRQKAREPHRLLEGKSVAMIFEKPSLRTRATFEVGAFQLGANSITVNARLGERESIPDIARNLERWVDGIVARVHSHAGLEELAEFSSVPVINALSDDYHPCQILADAQTILEHKGRMEGLKLAFIGDGNNVFASWAMLATRIPFELVLACPEGFEPNDRITAALEKAGGNRYAIVRDPAEAASCADALYTDVWTSMGQESELEVRVKAFRNYAIDAALMRRANPGAIFMHCLPAHRDEEVTGEVIDGPQSVVFDQAENRLHAQKAVMARLLGG